MRKRSDVVVSEKEIWDSVLQNQLSDRDIVRHILFKDISADHCSWLFPDVVNMEKKCSKKIVKSLLNINIDDIIEIVSATNMEEIKIEEFPWFYNLEDAIFVDLHMLSFSPLTNEEIGIHSPYCRLKTKTNTQRFGQAHSSFLRLLGLVRHEYGLDQITAIGQIIDDLPPSNRLNVLTKLYFSIPLIRNLYREEKMDLNNVVRYTKTFMKDSVIQRRLPSIRKMIGEIEYFRSMEK